MKIYTRHGDDGSTGLFGGARLLKSDQRVNAYGTVDEANAFIGMACAAGLPPHMSDMLARIQGELFTIGAELACAPGRESALTMDLIGAAEIERLEAAIDAEEVKLPEMRNFILPGGSLGGAALHVSRTIVRRAERLVVDMAQATPVRSEVLAYLNRLSDLLFVLARSANSIANAPEVPWKGLR